MKICLITPAPAHSRKGNRITAERWARILRELGHRVVVEQNYSEQPCDVMVALHARRSFASVKRFRRRYPAHPLVVALTGTDLYHDIHTSARAQQSLEMATRLIVLQPLGVAELPERLRDKARVIYQSVKKISTPPQPRRDVFEVGVFGHLRPVKDPFRAAKAVRLLPATSRIRVLHAGAALSKQMGKRARAEERSNARYRWLGNLSQGTMLRLLAHCRLAVLSSKMEGGANLISEAIAASVPVLASHIPGSVGLLGPDYPGYFPVGDGRALADLLRRAEREPEFLNELRCRLKSLRSLVDPARERQSWRCLLEELLQSAEPRPPGSGSKPQRKESVSFSVKRRATPEAPAIQEPRFTLIDCDGRNHRAEFAREVMEGLTSRPKHLSCRFFYDREGSQLFEAICDLPEYYLMRAEREILEVRSCEITGIFQSCDRQRARGEQRIPRSSSGNIALVELGSGSATKTRILITDFIRQHGRLRYVPVDISRAMLEESSRLLLRDYPALEILAIAGEYRDGLCRLRRGTNDDAKLILWLGSNIGNLHRDEATAFLRLVRDAMTAGDRFLIGVDLRKDRAVLESAYDDRAGITAQFNKNILARINRQLGGHFDLNAFEHKAVYRTRLGRVEMYLVSKRNQRVAIDELGITVPVAAGEHIHTENSYKYSLEEIERLAQAARLRVEQQWLDTDARFSVNLLKTAR